MAKDDYHVIVFRILKYLYGRLKKGEPVEPEMLRNDSKTCNVNESYWRYILISMQEEGMIRGLKKGKGQYEQLPEQLKDIQITPKGIDMLSDNRLGERVDQLIKGAIKIG
ncbi:MAG: hypothetical protein IJ174_02765 [Clostridia bacterium]|nr:hypothetical protein [Clostridia bacterium]